MLSAVFPAQQPPVMSHCVQGQTIVAVRSEALLGFFTGDIIKYGQFDHVACEPVLLVSDLAGHGEVIMMKRDLRFSRRALLKGIGAGAALLPLLESDPVDAQCLATGIKRLYVLAWPDGMLSSTSKWATTGNDPASWSLASFQSSLQPYQKDLLLLNGVDYKFLRDGPHSETTGHACFPGMLTGATYQSAGGSTANDVAGGPSIDQYIGTQLKAKGYMGLVSLNQGAFVDSTARLSWAAAGKPVIPDLDPWHVFSTYIKGKITTPPPGPGMVPAATGGASGTNAAPVVDTAKLAQKSILDYVMGDLKRFGNIVGSADKANIDQHLTYVRDIENGLGAISGNGGSGGGIKPGTVGNGSACGIPAAANGMTVPFKSTDNIPTVAKLHMDLAIAAFAADLTRCAVMQIGDQGAAHLILSWAPLNYKSGGPNPGDANTGDVNGFHAIAHRNAADKVNCDGWFQSQIAYIIGQMKSVVDPSGSSMLDSSVVLAMNNMRTGTHETSGVPVVMAGSCGGYFKTGRSLALPAGTPNNGVLVAVCNAMGVPV
ncbi:MAG: DUF1552 domain-containing protein, partial [Polyangia bacterium]